LRSGFGQIESLLDEFCEVRGWGVIREKMGEVVAQGTGDDAFVNGGREHHAHPLTELGDMRTGSLSTQTRSWGGQYGQLSYTHLGKGHTEYVLSGRVNEVKRQLANYRKFKGLTQERVTLAIELCKLKQTQVDSE
jgi:hypothetical protein